MLELVPLSLELCGIISDDIKFMFDKLEEVGEPCGGCALGSWLDGRGSGHEGAVVVDVGHVGGGGGCGWCGCGGSGCATHLPMRAG